MTAEKFPLSITYPSYPEVKIMVILKTAIQQSTLLMKTDYTEP